MLRDLTSTYGKLTRARIRMLEPQAPTGYVILEWLERGLVNINTACQNATNDSLLYVVFTRLCFRLFATTRENPSKARRMKLYSLLLSRTYCQLRDASLRRSNDTRSAPLCGAYRWRFYVFFEYVYPVTAGRSYRLTWTSVSGCRNSLNQVSLFAYKYDLNPLSKRSSCSLHHPPPSPTIDILFFLLSYHYDDSPFMIWFLNITIPYHSSICPTTSCTVL